MKITVSKESEYEAEVIKQEDAPEPQKMSSDRKFYEEQIIAITEQADAEVAKWTKYKEDEIAICQTVLDEMDKLDIKVKTTDSTGTISEPMDFIN